MKTDWKALCEDLLWALENAIRIIYREDGTKHISTADPIIARARAALAEPEPEVEGPTNEELRQMFVAHSTEILSDEGDDVAPLGLDAEGASSFARAVLARYGHQPAPPAAGEVAELVEFLRDWGDDYADEGTKWHRAAELLEQRHPVPVPVAERLQQLEDLAADAVSGLRYIEQTHGRLYGVGWDRVYEKADRLQPGHALPLPVGEVQP